MQKLVDCGVKLRFYVQSPDGSLTVLLCNHTKKGSDLIMKQHSAVATNQSAVFDHINASS